ncbi:DUF1428 domain-containing protein [Bdellovibrio sp. HCB117]|uniref:DUF1428 domain-containing protein n=1 Tax=Bdellovibrio sp. HCB117 TaxID=3394359 RepID=UPI0039B47B1C
MAYVDGFVIAIKKSKLKKYQQMSKKASKVWMKYGALEYIETVGDDLKVKGVMPFTKLAKTESGETVVFSWIVYKSKAHRNAVNKKVMADPFMTSFDPKDSPFEMHKMAYGGFKTIVSVK